MCQMANFKQCSERKQINTYTQSIGKCETFTLHVCTMYRQMCLRKWYSEVKYNFCSSFPRKKLQIKINKFMNKGIAPFMYIDVILLQSYNDNNKQKIKDILKHCFVFQYNYCEQDLNNSYFQRSSCIKFTGYGIHDSFLLGSLKLCICFIVITCGNAVEHLLKYSIHIVKNMSYLIDTKYLLTRLDHRKLTTLVISLFFLLETRYWRSNFQVLS